MSSFPLAGSNPGAAAKAFLVDPVVAGPAAAPAQVSPAVAQVQVALAQAAAPDPVDALEVLRHAQRQWAPRFPHKWFWTCAKAIARGAG